MRIVKSFIIINVLYTTIFLFWDKIHSKPSALYYIMRIVKSFIINDVLYMTISLPLKHNKAPLYRLYSYYMPMNMSDYKTFSSSYTKIEISHPYLLLSDDQFALLDHDMDRNTIQYDHMYVQTTPILLFRCTNKNCYINIIEHATANVITSTCTFLYYHNITVHASLVTTNDFFFLLNMQEELKVTCGLYNWETTRSTYSASFVNRKDLCDCFIQTAEIQLIGSHSNCSSNGNFDIYYTFNFVTEWIYNKMTMSCYWENDHILSLPSQAKLLGFSVLKSNTSNVFTESETLAISLHKLDALVNTLKHEEVYLKV